MSASRTYLYHPRRGYLTYSLFTITFSLKKSERIVIVRSKVDDRQIPWAVELKDMLKKRYNLNSFVSPKIEDYENSLNNSSPQNEEEKKVAIAPGRFKR